jgi:hypothetical protein
MKLRTIWALHMAMPFKERVRRTVDVFAQETAAHLPKSLKYYVTLQQIGKATMDSRNVPGATVEEILPKLDRPKWMP